MNRTKLKNYAPQARRDFIAAATDRAAYYGLTKQKIELITEQGDVALISGKPFPRNVAEKRKRLEGHIKQYGFEQIMEAMAYTWFNRLVAIRFMELHGYLDHGYRVLSHPEGKPTPEILEHAEHVDLPGLKNETVIDLKLAGNKEPELYRLLLTAQCNALHTAMPFLFEKIDDETELLLPDNLLHSDSLIRKLVNAINEEDWQEVEIIGWLYQFYISEKKDQVIGRVVKSEDIPAATQLFTPNWIVKYLVQNTLGRQWLATYPDSPLKQQMEYYIEPAEQTLEVQEQLKALAPDSLNPEELTLLDPACGSGHILVEAYNLLKAIYLERGYRAGDIPRLILEKNLYGLEIDDRAAQLAAFALMMKARADDRRIFGSGIQPHVWAIQESKGLDAAELTKALNVPILKEKLPPSAYLFEEIEEENSPLLSRKNLSVKGDISQASVAQLLDLFEHGKTFGSLIRVPEELAEKLPAIAQRVEDVLTYGGLLEQVEARVFGLLVQQARMLAGRYDAVVTNPPYMGTKYFPDRLKKFIASEYKDAKADLYASFIQRNSIYSKANAFIGMITIPNWMFLSSFEKVRYIIFDSQTIDTFIHNGRGIFGSDFGSCSFVLRNSNLPTYRGVFRRLFEKQGSVASNEELEHRFFEAENHLASPGDFKKLPGQVIAYWISEKEREAFARSDSFTRAARARQGLATADDDRFFRLWHEVSLKKIGFNFATKQEAIRSGMKWFPLNKGGPFRKWYGNNDYLVDWENDGKRLKDFRPRSVIRNEEAYFQEGITWSLISISAPSFRLFYRGCIIGHKGPGIYSNGLPLLAVLAYLNSCVVTNFLKVISPTVGFEIGQIQNLPFRNPGQQAITLAQKLVDLYRQDWDSYETSWCFLLNPFLSCSERATTAETACTIWAAHCTASIALAKALEEENNRLFIECFDLQNEISPEVPETQISLYRPNREEDIKRLISYAIGCMMGRYSLDKPGLIYAHSGNKGFDPSQYQTFPADADGIIPLTELEWFEGDGANRLEQFIATALPREHLEENLKFIADGHGPNRNEQPHETIRHYLATGFYKHHLSMYKRRPIYWLFSSGKQRAFQCLVYLHRYNDGTLSRMRTEYVIPLQGKIASRIGQLADDISAASSTFHRKKLEKERGTLAKQQAELYTFGEKLRHYADKRISLDLDDGVKINYGKFGDLLAEVKTVTGGAMEGDS